MLTLKITRTLGGAIDRLRNGWIIIDYRRRARGSVSFFWYRQNQETVRISTSVMDMLLQSKLIYHRKDFTHAWWQVRKSYFPTDLALTIHLPPEEFWFEDD